MIGPGHREHVAPFVRCGAGRDECPRGFTGFYYHCRERQAADDPVANREVLCRRSDSGRVLAQECPLRDYLGGEGAVLGRIDGVEAVTEHRQCAPAVLEGCPVRVAVNTPRQATHDGQPSNRQLAGQLRGDAATVGRAAPGTDHGDGAAILRGELATDIQHRRRSRNGAQQRWIALLVQPGQHRYPRCGQPFDFSIRVYLPASLDDSRRRPTINPGLADLGRGSVPGSLDRAEVVEELAKTLRPYTGQTV